MWWTVDVIDSEIRSSSSRQSSDHLSHRHSPFIEGRLGRRLETDYGRTRYTLTGTNASIVRISVAAGVRVGYRFAIAQSHLYVAPWLGVDYTFGAIGADIAGHTFDEKRIQLFPTVHVGWRF
jgi:hypothetical protein